MERGHYSTGEMEEMLHTNQAVFINISTVHFKHFYVAEVCGMPDPWKSDTFSAFAWRSQATERNALFLVTLPTYFEKKERKESLDKNKCLFLNSIFSRELIAKNKT